MVYLYALNTACLPKEGEEQYFELLESLFPERREKVKRCRNVEKQRQSLGAGLLLQKVLQKHGIATQGISQNSYGKPEVLGLCFNLSHSKDFVICAVSSKDVGCDVEYVRQAPEKVGERYFGEREKAFLKKEQSEYDEVFFRLWTIKESYMKMTGEGMRLPLSAFEVCFDNGVRIVRDQNIQPCFVHELDVQGYHIAVCAKEEEISDIIWMDI